MSDTDFDFEPIRGIPAPLPPGETLLWQGSPDWKRLATRPFRVHWVALWFAGWVLFKLIATLYAGTPLAAELPGLVATVALGSLACAILLTLAWLTARVTVYSITSERVLIRFGIALQVTMNLPFRRIESAAIARLDGDAGDIALALVPEEKAGYAVLWPHVRPGTMGRTQPMLRALDDARAAAGILANAVQAAGGATTHVSSDGAMPASTTSGAATPTVASTVLAS